MVLNMQFVYTEGTIPILLVRQSVPFSYSNIVVDQSKLHLLTDEEKSIASNGRGRPDQIAGLLLRHCEVSQNERTMLKMQIMAWIDTLDLAKPEDRRLFAAAYPIVYLGGIVKIKTQRVEEGLKIKEDGEIREGKLRFWTVLSDGTGVCALEPESEHIKFTLDDLLSDITLVELVKCPEWFGWIFPKWQGRGTRPMT